MSVELYAAEFSRQPWRTLFAVSIAGFVFSAFLGRHSELPALCGGPWADLIGRVGLFEALRLTIDLAPYQSLAVEWSAMVFAMMPLLIARPTTYVRQSLPSTRAARSIIGFAIGYVLVWLAAGVVLVAVAALLAAFFSPGMRLAASIAIAIAWSSAPWHQAALNRGHRVRRLGMFGRRGDSDAVLFGMEHGAWCFGACWAWMLVPLTALDFHLVAMVIVTIVTLAERLAPPALPRWRTPPGVRLMSVVYSNLLQPARIDHA